MMSALDIVVPGQTPVVPGRGYASRANIVFNAGAYTADNTVITADSTDITADAA